MTELANHFRLHKLNQVEKFVMSYGGLRGAVAFALVLLIKPSKVLHQPLFVTATISVVFFTVFFQVSFSLKSNQIAFCLLSSLKNAKSTNFSVKLTIYLRKHIQ